MADEIQRCFYRVRDVQRWIGYEHEFAARRLVERLEKRGLIHLRRVGRSIYVPIDEIHGLFGIKSEPSTTPPTAPERAVV